VCSKPILDGLETALKLPKISLNKPGPAKPSKAMQEKKRTQKEAVIQEMQEKTEGPSFGVSGFGISTVKNQQQDLLV